MAYIIHENQLKDILNDAMAENQGVSKDDIIKWIMNNPDIKIMASDKYGDTKSVGDYLSTKTDDEIDELFGTVEDENGNPVEDTESVKPSKQEKIDYAKKYNENEYSKIWNNAIKGFDETEPLMENAKKVTEAYEKLWDKKNQLTSLYNSGQSGDPEVYQSKLDQINKALEDAENSNEFKRIVDAIRENGGASTEDSLLHPIVNATLEQMAVHYGSRMGHEKGESIKNTLVGDLANSSLNKWTGGKYSLSELPEIYDMYNTKKDKNATNGDKKSKGWEVKDSKKTNEKINNLTDAMKFGDDVASAGGEDYLKARDEKLALALKIKGIESPEEIDKFLSKYDSWKNAKDEWKQNTLANLSDKVSQITDEDIVNKVKAAKDKKTNKDDNNIYDENGKVIGKKHIDIKKKNVGDNWTPSNDDSINGVEDEKKQSVIKDAIDIASGKKKITKEDIYDILPDKAKQLIDGINKEAKARLNAKEHIWDTDENGYRDPDSPINGTEEEDIKATNEKGGKGTSKKETKQTSKNNKFLYITKEVQKLKPNERIKYLKEHGFSVDKNGYFTKNGMKTLVYKDGQYNPKYVKPDKEEGYNDRTLVEPKQDKFQIALQKSGYQGPRDANGNFLPMTDKYLDIMEAKKNLKDKSKK